MKDVLGEISRISLLFQRDNITVSSAVSKLHSVYNILRNMTRNPGDNLQQFLEDVQEIDREHQYKGQTLSTSAQSLGDGIIRKC